MHRYRQALYLVVAVLGVAALVWWLRPNDQRRIRKQFHRLCETLNKVSPENNSTTALKMLTFGYLFTDRIAISLRQFPYNGEMSAELLTSQAARGRALCETIALQPLELDITVDTPESATVLCVLKVRLQSPHALHDEVRHFQASLRKVDNAWRFSGFADDGILEK